MDKKTDFYSRQVSSIGKDTHQKLETLSIVIIGLDILGIELCKCLSLMGIQNIYIYDPRYYKYKNLHFLKVYNTTIEKKVLEFLQKLNPFNTIELYTKSKHIDILIQTNITISFNNCQNPIELNQYCRDKNIKFLCGVVNQFTGYYFSDLLIHTIYDDNGETIINYVKDILRIDNKTLITLEKRCEFTEGDTISYNNNTYLIDSVSHNDNKIIINDTLSDSKNISVTLQKSKIELQYGTIDKCFDNSIITSINCEKKNVASIKKKIIPLLKNPHFEETNYQFPIVSSIMASIISQEIIKITGKYTPIHQEFIIDYSELSCKLNDLYTTPDKNFEDIYNLLPKKIIQHLKKMKIFLVGCGALGCEYMKNMAMLNMCTGCNSNLSIADMDKIELSNLNRQFLFSESDISKSKSEVASQKILNMNDNMQIRCYQDKIDKSSESIFSKAFWEKQDIIINALDNVESRKYVDSQCVVYKKPLLEAGTLGTKSNIQFIIPYQTATYSDTNDPQTSEIPVCTIKYYPYAIEHCIEWSLEIFNYYFNTFNIFLDAYTRGKDQCKDLCIQLDNENIIHKLVKVFDFIKPFFENPNNETFLQFLKNLYYYIFILPIHNLRLTYPEDYIDKNGNLFWTGTKIFPNLCSDDTLFNEFINTFGNIFAESIGYKFSISDICCLNKNEIDSFIEYQTIPTNSLSLKETIEYLYETSNNFKLQITKIQFSENEKYINCVKNLTNIRADTYSIEKIDFSTCHLLSTKITPALSSTTTLTTSLAMMEFLKYIYNQVLDTRLELHDYFINTGINLYLQSRLMKPIKFISNTFNSIIGQQIITMDSEYITTWDRYILPSYIVTIKDFISHIQVKYSIKISQICLEDNIIYNCNKTSNVGESIINLYLTYNISTLNYLIFTVIAFHKNKFVMLPKIYFSN